MVQDEAIVTVTARITLTDYQRMVDLTQQLGLTKGTGDPNISATVNHLIAIGLNASNGNGHTPDQIPATP